MESLYKSATGALFKRYYNIHNGDQMTGYNTDKIGYGNAINSFINECNKYYVNFNQNNYKEVINDNIDNIKSKIEYLNNLKFIYK